MSSLVAPTDTALTAAFAKPRQASNGGTDPA
jgi:hypothetical protein